MRNLIIKKTIKCEFTPNQWELYTTKYDDSELRPVVKDLNESLEILYNNDHDKKFTLDTMIEELKKYKRYGAYDSEPIYFLQTVIEKIYGE